MKIRTRRSGPPRAPRRATVLVAVAGVLAVAATVVLRQPAPVGHFTSADAKDRFDVAYRTAMADLPEPAATLDVRTGYGVVRVYRFDGAGQGDPFVLLPGRASATPVWADNLPSLLELRDVYTLDLLGEPGASVQDRPIESEEDQARWLGELLEALPEDEFHLVGTSIGGWTAANLAVHRPERLASVTLLDPVFVFADMSVEAVVRSIPASVRWFPRSWRDSFGSWTAGGAPVEDVPVADVIEAGMQGYRLALPAPGRIAETDLAGLDVPVLAVLAGRSVMHDTAEAAATARRVLPRGRVLVYGDASHAINGEHPDRIAADLSDFLDDLANLDEVRRG